MKSAYATLHCHCGLSGRTTFFLNYFINGTIFENKKNAIEPKMRVLIFSKTLAQAIFYSKKNQASYDQNL
jgi:hypothetical protein